MHCCGMSMTLTNQPRLSAFLQKSKPIESEKFYLLVVIVLLGCMINEFLTHYSYMVEERKNHLVKDIFVVAVSSVITFCFSWALMMLSMTSNVYILCAMVLGKTVMKVFCMKVMGTRKKYCCM